jgi:hypothetical protein
MNLTARALLALAEAVPGPEGDEATRKAVALYERKGNVVAAQRLAAGATVERSTTAP